jgi:DNA-binding MarR family transcriptional regulator
MRTMKPEVGELRAATRCINLRVRRPSRLVTRHFEHALQDTGLSAARFSLMGMVALKQPLSPIALAGMLDLDKSTLSRNLRPLIHSGVLISKPVSAGGQSLLITRKGRAVLQRALPAWKKAQVEVLAMLGEDVVSRLDGMIAAMAEG